MEFELVYGEDRVQLRTPFLYDSFLVDILGMNWKRVNAPWSWCACDSS